MFAGVALGSTALFAAWTVAPLVSTELTGNRSLSGVPGAAGVLGTAAGSTLLSSIMARRGRRPGLALGWTVGIAGAVLAALATETRSVGLLYAGMILIGIGHASNQLARFAAADIHPVERRARVLGLVVWASTVGAVLGPALLSITKPIAERAGLPPLAGGFAAAVVFYAAALAAAAALKPDPATFATGEVEVPALSARGGLRAHARQPTVRLAIAALVAAQASMIFVMTITPVHLRDGGHGLGIVGGVMSAHLLGMFGFAPLMGRVVERIGHAPTMLVGSAILLGANVAAAVTKDAHGAVLGGPLFFLGVGWSFTFVAGSALLTHGLSYADRARLQGGVDTIVWTVAATSSLLSGVALGSIGFAWVCALAALIALVPVRAALGARARTAAASEARA